MKYALLDTDFISKAHIVQSNEGGPSAPAPGSSLNEGNCPDRRNHLIDRVLEMPGYTFFCHAQTKVELARHNQAALDWLSRRIVEGEIQKYDDRRILQEMQQVYRGLATHNYTQSLRTACDTFDRTYFRTYYAPLDSPHTNNSGAETYLSEVSRLDNAVGSQNNLGEIKEYVLLQWLRVLHGDQMFYFCSDDKKARVGILGLEDISVQCVTFLSSFQRLHAERGFSQADMQPYIDSALGFFSHYKQSQIRVASASSEQQKRVPCAQVFREIFEDKFLERRDGLLKYKA